jgi:serine/threonine protein kinase
MREPLGLPAWNAYYNTIGVAPAGGLPLLRPRAADERSRRQPHTAPEQAAGRAELRSNLYSLAATLYHLLAGVPPADAETRASLLAAGLPDPLRPLHDIRADLSSEASAAIHAALALKPAERPSSAAEMRAALRHARGAPAAGSPGGAPGATRLAALAVALKESRCVRLSAAPP